MNSFSKYAAIYDRSRRQLIPRLDDFYGSLICQLPPNPQAILDLGAGTGLLSEMILEKHPEATLTLIDVSKNMLLLAEERLQKYSKTRFLIEDYVAEEFHGPYNAIVSGLSIHHVDEDSKKALFRKAYQSLLPGGLFINADQVLGETPEMAQKQHDAWVAEVRATGISEEDLSAAFERMKEDKLSTLSDQMTWLAEVGFHEVDCVYRNLHFATYLGKRF